MAIALHCPHCDKAYKLKDELAGKRVACTNPNCKKVFTVEGKTVPSVQSNGAPRGSASVDELAHALLAEGAQVEEKAPEAEAAVVGAPIRVKCQFCDHENLFEARLAGRNAPCQNEDCRKIIKVPLPKKEDPKDWRTVQKRPSAAKVDTPELEGAWGNVQGTAVSREALVGAEADRVEVREPRTWGQLAKIGLLTGAILLLVVVGVVWVMKRRTQGKQDKAMEMALQFLSADPKLPGKLKKEQAGLIHVLAGEYDLAKNNPVEAKRKLNTARGEIDLTNKNSPERSAALIELAAAQASLAGTKKQVEQGFRLDFDKDQIATEVRSTLQKLPDAPGEELRDMHAQALRRLTRVLGPTNPQALGPLASGVPKTERAEVLAVVGLELLSLGQREEAKKIAKLASDFKSTNAPSLIALWLALGGADASQKEQETAVANAGAVAPPPVGDKPISPVARIGYAEGLARQGKIDDGRKLAAAAVEPNERLRALAAVAAVVVQTRKGEVADVEQCAKVLESELKARASSWLVLRLVQLALQGENRDLAARLAAAIPDAGLRSWARYEVLKNRLQSGSEAGTDAVNEVGDPERLAHWLAWVEVARQKAIAAGPGSAISEIKKWTPEAQQAFGYAGVALAEK